MYEPVPDHAKCLRLVAHWCGDDECNCNHLTIQACPDAGGRGH